MAIRTITELIAHGMTWQWAVTGGCSDEFDCGVSEDDTGHDNHQREEAGGEKAAMLAIT